MAYDVRKFGRNADVDAAVEDIHSGGGIHVAPTAARIHTLVSGSTADAAAGTGCRNVVVSGVDSDWDRFSELVAMNGTTGVAMDTASPFIDRMENMAPAGSNMVNAGLITATAADDATVSARIDVGVGQTLMALYAVPRNFELEVKQLWFTLLGTVPATKTVELSVWVKTAADTANPAMAQKYFTKVDTDDTQFHKHDMHDAPLIVPEKSIVIMKAAPNAADFDISAGFMAKAVRIMA